MTTKQFVKTAQGAPIQGYTEKQHRTKQAWLRKGKAICKELAEALGLDKGSYDISVNPAGPAVSGDICLHGEWIYVMLTQFSLGPDCSFMWRTCNDRKDFTGNANQWAKWESLLNLQSLAGKMRLWRPATSSATRTTA